MCPFAAFPGCMSDYRSGSPLRLHPRDIDFEKRQRPSRWIDPGEPAGTVLTSQPRTLLKAGYASPEQVLGEPVTTATDVYQLGVLLYELLTGRAPYRLHSQDADEICKAISEQAPERPSLVVIQPDQSAEVAVRIARARQVSPPELQRFARR